jgi:hypothetical protein
VQAAARWHVNVLAPISHSIALTSSFSYRRNNYIFSNTHRYATELVRLIGKHSVTTLQHAFARSS